MEGKSPIYMQTADAIQRIADKAPDEKAAKKKLRELESEAWEDFLDMTISQAILWAATNTEPEKKASEIMACDPTSSGRILVPPVPGFPVRRISRPKQPRTSISGGIPT